MYQQKDHGTLPRMLGLWLLCKMRLVHVGSTKGGGVNQSSLTKGTALFIQDKIVQYEHLYQLDRTLHKRII